MMRANVMRFGILNLDPGSPALRLMAGPDTLAIPAEYIDPQAIAHNWIPTYAGA
jgi:hypothetical protein